MFSYDLNHLKNNLRNYLDNSNGITVRNGHECFSVVTFNNINSISPIIDEHVTKIKDIIEKAMGSFLKMYLWQHDKDKAIHSLVSSIHSNVEGTKVGILINQGKELADSIIPAINEVLLEYISRVDIDYTPTQIPGRCRDTILIFEKI